MSITSNSLIHDSFHCFKNQLNDFCIFSLISTLISLIFYYFLVPMDEMVSVIKTFENNRNSLSLIQWINQLSDTDKLIILKVLMLSYISVLFGLILLISSVITYLCEVNAGHFLSILNVLILAMRIFPNMLLMLLTCTLLIYLGLLFLIFPGIILVVTFALSPIILITKKNTTPLNAIIESWKLGIQYWKLIIIILLFWLIAQTLLAICLGSLYFLPGILQNIISFVLNNLLNVFVLIYFFRLYMLIKV